MVEEVIRAKRFEVIDDAGRPRVIIGAQAEASGLMLLDPNGQSMGELAVSDELGSTTLSLYDLRGSVRASLGFGPGRLSDAWALRSLGGAARFCWSRGGEHARARLHRPLRGGADVRSRSTRRACRASSSWTAKATTASLFASTGVGRRTWSSSTPTAGRFGSETGLQRRAAASRTYSLHREFR